MKRISRKNISFFAVIILFAVCFLTFIVTPLAGDVKVFAACARQADYVGGNWIYNAYNTWELKSVFSRTYIYLLYKAVEGITGFGNYFFAMGIKLLYGLVTIVFLIFAVWMGEGNRSGREKTFYVLVSSILVFSAQATVHMQVEMTCTVILLAGFGLYMNAVRTSRKAGGKLLAAGLCIGSVFFFKSVLIIMSAAFVAAAYLWDKKHGFTPSLKRFWLLVLGSVLMLLAGGLSILLLNPGEIQDILAASVFQDTLFSAKDVSLKALCLYGIYQFLAACLKTPGLLLGVVAGMINFMKSLRERSADRIFMRAVLWAVPAMFVLLSNKYPLYHYFVFLFPGIIELLLMEKDVREMCGSRRFRVGAYLVFFLIFLSFLLLPCLGLFNESFRSLGILAVCILTAAAAAGGLLGFEKGVRGCCLAAVFIAGVIYLNYISVFSVNCQDYIRLDKLAYETDEEVISSVRSEEMLYLDYGIGAYLFGARSHLKYYYPLPLERLTEESEYSRMECYVESREGALQYDGTYVSVCSDWFFAKGKNEAIREKLDAEYVKTDEYAVYSPDNELFVRNDESLIVYFELYERKQD